jgi:hypothetical protein
MKSEIDEKLIIRLLSVTLLRYFFIAVMILGVSAVSTHNNQKRAITMNKPMMVINVANPQFLEKEPDSDKTENILSSDCENEAECVLNPIILQAAIRHQIDPALVKAIIMAESGYNPKAISKKGAIGLMQLMPGTAQALGVVDAFNPKENISGGVRYFKQLINQFNGDIKLALAAYNAGSKRVRHYKGIPPFKTTQYYIKKVFKYYNLYKNQMTGEVDKA